MAYALFKIELPKWNVITYHTERRAGQTFKLAFTLLRPMWERRQRVSELGSAVVGTNLCCVSSNWLKAWKVNTDGSRYPGGYPSPIHGGYL